MFKNNSRFKYLLYGVSIILGLFLIDIFIEIVAPDIKEYLEKTVKIPSSIIYSIFSVICLIALFIASKDIWKDGKSKESQLFVENIEPDIKLLFNSLKERYQKRFDSKLDGRFEITLEVNKDWNFNQPQTFKVNYRENTNIDEAFRTINEAFERQGRLLIVGSPGSGKTVLLLKLAIELLGEDCKVDQKLPVIFNLASWSPDYAKFDDWLIDVLKSGYGVNSPDFARTLLEQNRIIFLLDGLDELARNEAVEIAIEKRAKCLDSLNDYLRMGRKAVICCRREEFAEMQKATNQEAPVSAKVEVLDLGKAEIILALQHAQQDTKSKASATNLLKIIETNDVFLDVLATPFYFTTALEVFDSEILKDKDFPTDEDAIKKYLLEKFIASKLKHANILTEFEKEEAKIKKWLSWLAKLMEKKQLVSFELADLKPKDLRRSWHFGLTFYMFFLFSFIAQSSWVNIFFIIFGSSIVFRQLDIRKAEFSKILFNNTFLVKSFIYFIIGFGSFCVFIFIFCLFFLALNFVQYFRIDIFLFFLMVITMFLLTFPIIFLTSFLGGVLSQIAENFGFETQDNLRFSLLNLFNKNVFKKIISNYIIFLLIAILGISLSILIVTIGNFFIKYLEQINYTNTALSIRQHTLIPLSFEYLPFYIFFFLLLGIVFSLINSNLKVTQIKSLKNPYQRLNSGIFLSLFEWVVFTEVMMLLMVFYEIRLEIYSDDSLTDSDKFVGFIIVLILVFLVSLIRGGFYGIFFTPVFSHFLLRLCLYLEGSNPIKYATFLNLAAEARILEKDGGHWRFRHQTLQEHFAKMDVKS